MNNEIDLDSDEVQEPNTGIIQEPNTGIIQEPNTGTIRDLADDVFQEPNTQ